MARVKTTGKRKAVGPSTAITKKARTTTRLARASIGIGFPEKLRTTVRYFSIVDLGAATFTTTKNYFSANGLYDPDITNAGHQPIGFDQLMTIYNHYVVLGSKIRVQFFGREDTNSSMSGVVGIYADDSSSNSLNHEGLVENADKNKWAAYTSQSNKISLSDTYKSSVIYSEAPLADQSQRGTAAANPTEVHSWCVWNANQASTTESVYAAVEIEYDAVFFERTDLATS